MRQKKVWVYKDDEKKTDFYKVNLGDVLINKQVYDRMVGRFGEKKTIDFIQRLYVTYIPEGTYFMRACTGKLEETRVDDLIDAYVKFDEKLNCLFPTFREENEEDTE